MVTLLFCLLKDMLSWRITALLQKLWGTRGSLRPCSGPSQQTTMVQQYILWLDVGILATQIQSQSTHRSLSLCFLFSSQTVFSSSTGALAINM